eukprot:scaffold42750_cov60-Phaeocystis_antarctica.AAC.1
MHGMRAHTPWCASALRMACAWCCAHGWMVRCPTTPCPPKARAVGSSSGRRRLRAGHDLAACRSPVWCMVRAMVHVHGACAVHA